MTDPIPAAPGGGDSAPTALGRKIRELRVWRGLTQIELAHLAGYESGGAISMIERGQRIVDKRSTLEGIARALRVAPAELGAPTAGEVGDSDLAEALGLMVPMEAALTEVTLGEVTAEPREWEQLRADVAHLDAVLRPSADYAALAAALPGLIRDLHAHLARTPAARREVLVGLMDAYQSAAMTCKYLGVRGLPAVAAMHARQVAEELDEPAWVALAGWIRAMNLGAGRERMRDLAMSVAGDCERQPGRDARELYGMCHLTSAMASAVIGDADTSRGHLGEARAVAESMPEQPGSGFGALRFGRMNVRFWETALAVEMGEPGRVVELRERVVPELVGSRGRQAAYWADLGRGLSASGRQYRDDAVAAFVTAETLSPLRTRANPLVREAVTDLRARVRRDAVGRELRGLAYRMGIAS